MVQRYIDDFVIWLLGKQVAKPSARSVTHFAGFDTTAADYLSGRRRSLKAPSLSARARSMNTASAGFFFKVTGPPQRGPFCLIRFHSLIMKGRIMKSSRKFAVLIIA